MSIEFPEDLLPLPGAITGTERILANKNTVTINDVKEFVQDNVISVSAHPIDLNLQSADGYITNINWIGGSIVTVGPVVMLQGSFSFEVTTAADGAVVYVEYDPNEIPNPASGRVLGTASRLSSSSVHQLETSVLIGEIQPSSPLAVAINIDNSTIQPYDEISFFISYIADE